MLRRLLTPSLLDVFFVALLLSAFAQPRGLRSLLGDGDTGWHIRTGELVLATGRVPVVDPFSYSRPHGAWFAWEWLADVVFAATWRWRGLGGVAALGGVVLALGATALLARMLRRGSGLWIGLAATMAAVSASSVHYLARPHVFSILFFTVALWVLCEDRVRRRRLVWLVVPLTALWANLHAGFVAWLATLGLLVMLSVGQRDWSGVRRYGCLAGLCTLASLLNPYGWQLHLHIARYLNSSWILDNVQEFQSPHIRAEGMIVFALLLLSAVALSPQADRFEALLVVVWGFLALRSARHVPFFAIVAAPVVASAAAACWARVASGASGRAGWRIFWDLAQEFGRRPRASVWLPLSAALVVAAAPAVTFPDKVFPVQAVEGNVLRLAPSASMPRILTSDQWGDYLIYRLYPRQRVFFDGRSDFFGPVIGADYQKLLAGESPWRELLDRYQFELALLPHDWALSTALELVPGWRKVYEDGVAVLYARELPNPAQPEPNGNTTSPQRRGDAEISAECSATDEPVVEWDGKPESVILTRRRGDAEIGAEKQREKENERGDSGGTWPSVRRGRASAEKTKTEMAGRSAIQALARGVGRAILPAAAFEAALPTDSRAVAHGERRLKAGGSQDWLPHEVLP